MSTIDNILNKINSCEQSVFTKDEVIKIIQDVVIETELQPIESNGVILQPKHCTIVQGDEVKLLPKKVFKMLYYLMSNPNVFATRKDIIDNCWDKGVIVGARTIDVHAYKIKSILKNKSQFKTHKGVGYGWVINHTKN